MASVISHPILNLSAFLCDGAKDEQIENYAPIISLTQQTSRKRRQVQEEMLLQEEGALSSQSDRTGHVKKGKRKGAGGPGRRDGHQRKNKKKGKKAKLPSFPPILFIVSAGYRELEHLTSSSIW